MAIGRLITTSPTEPEPRVPRPRRAAWRALERLLLLVGVVALGYCAYVLAESHLYQAMENRELDAILASGPTVAPGAAAADVPESVADVPESVRRPGSVIGRIEIPRLDVSVVIRSGVDARTLRLAVGHIPGTAYPGEIGNVGLAGHRDTFFRRLRDIRPDDEIRLVTPDGTYRFRVADTSVVKPRDVWVLDPTPTPTLTLVTCYPFSYVGAAPERFIVRAEVQS